MKMGTVCPAKKGEDEEKVVLLINSCCSNGQLSQLSFPARLQCKLKRSN